MSDGKAEADQRALRASMKGSSILTVKQFTRPHVDAIFALADQMKSIVETAGGCDLLKGRVMANLFYEPSTRTSSSFHAAMARLGGQVIPITDVANSSVAKGETLADTVRCLENYADVIVLRHPQLGAAAEAASHIRVPLLNAGDGTGEHPTQALLDCYTILSELGKIDGLTITMLGDLKHGRTVHSLARLLSLFSVKINYVAPEKLRMPAEIVKEVGDKGIEQREHTDLSACLAATDVLYVTRVQKERFEDKKEYERLADVYIITPELLTEHKAKSTLRIMHPLPRVNEISTKLDKDPRAAYFRQMRCGLFVRMALLALVLGKA